MKLSYTILYVNDVKQTLTFYQQALGLEASFVHESGLYAELPTGETKLAFAAESMAGMNQLDIQPTTPNAKAPAFEIAFTVEDVNAAVANAAQAGAKVLQEPNEKPWGQTVAHIQDINGFIIELCTEISK